MTWLLRYFDVIRMHPKSHLLDSQFVHTTHNSLVPLHVCFVWFTWRCHSIRTDTTTCVDVTLTVERQTPNVDIPWHRKLLLPSCVLRILFGKLISTHSHKSRIHQKRICYGIVTSFDFSCVSTTRLSTYIVDSLRVGTNEESFYNLNRQQRNTEYSISCLFFHLVNLRTLTNRHK